AAAEGLPLGLADKVFLGVDRADDLPIEGHLFGRTDRTATASYQLRPLGRPYIEAYLGGRCAAALEAEGPGAMTAFAIDELANLMGSDFRRRLTPLRETAWRTDPWARGAYSHALPGHAGARAVLAAPVEGRIFFAGEAVSAHAYSTAHGAWSTGEAAAEAALVVMSG
ncbi:MAG TPA: FAD-dependent oxidoreductase, partial [Phenylobacterium sp.]|nr:FAD-dependent oxidoreductase [Phenylobacterium sp.]